MNTNGTPTTVREIKTITVSICSQHTTAPSMAPSHWHLQRNPAILKAMATAEAMEDTVDRRAATAIQKANLGEFQGKTFPFKVMAAMVKRKRRHATTHANSVATQLPAARKPANSAAEWWHAVQTQAR